MDYKIISIYINCLISQCRYFSVLNTAGKLGKTVQFEKNWGCFCMYSYIFVHIVRILKTRSLSSVSFVYFLIFCLHFIGIISIYLSDHLVYWCVRRPNVYLMFDPIICQNRSLKQTPAGSAVCVLYEPHFLLESRFREMSWLSVYLQGTSVPKLTLGPFLTLCVKMSTNWKTGFLGSRPISRVKVDSKNYNQHFIKHDVDKFS